MDNGFIKLNCDQEGLNTVLLHQEEWDRCFHIESISCNIDDLACYATSIGLINHSVCEYSTMYCLQG